jgi:NUMOD3 motif-containing protein
VVAQSEANVSVFYGYVDYTNDGRPFYVGKGAMLRVRWAARNKRHETISKRHGRVRKIEFASSIEQAAFDWETDTIARLRTFVDDSDLGCNLTRGGEIAKIVSGDVRRRLSEARQRRGPTSEATLAKMRQAHLGQKPSPQCIAASIAKNTGRPSFWRGRKQPAEMVERRRTALKGRVITSETREKISATLKGRKVPPEALAKRGPRGPMPQAQREAISKALTGKKRPYISEGQDSPAARLTDDQVRRLREARQAGAKLSDLARQFNISITTASYTARGLRWGHVKNA